MSTTVYYLARKGQSPRVYLASYPELGEAFRTTPSAAHAAQWGSATARAIAYASLPPEFASGWEEIEGWGFDAPTEEG